MLPIDLSAMISYLDKKYHSMQIRDSIDVRNLDTIKEDMSDN